MVEEINKDLDKLSINEGYKNECEDQSNDSEQDLSSQLAQDGEEDSQPQEEVKEP